MSEPTFDELLDVAERMAQEIRDNIDAAEAAGQPLPGAEELLEEFDALWRRTNRYWPSTCQDEELPEGLAKL